MRLNHVESKHIMFSSMIPKFLRSGIDLVLSKAIRGLIEPQIASYGGAIQDFNLDTSSKQVRIKVLFEREVSPIEIQAGYELSSVGDKTFISIVSITSDRKWVGLMLSDLLKRGLLPSKQEIPGIAGHLIG